MLSKASSTPPTALLLHLTYSSSSISFVQKASKPNLAWRPEKSVGDVSYDILDSAGLVLHSGSFHVPQVSDSGADELEGDVLIPSVADIYVKVPDVAGASQMAFTKNDAQRASLGQISLQ
jgi:hypothetical protein